MVSVRLSMETATEVFDRATGVWVKDDGRDAPRRRVNPRTGEVLPSSPLLTCDPTALVRNERAETVLETFYGSSEPRTFPPGYHVMVWEILTTLDIAES